MVLAVAMVVVGDISPRYFVDKQLSYSVVVFELPLVVEFVFELDGQYFFPVVRWMQIAVDHKHLSEQMIVDRPLIELGEK